MQRADLVWISTTPRPQKPCACMFSAAVSMYICAGPDATGGFYPMWWSPKSHIHVAIRAMGPWTLLFGPNISIPKSQEARANSKERVLTKPCRNEKKLRYHSVLAEMHQQSTGLFRWNWAYVWTQLQHRQCGNPESEALLHLSWSLTVTPGGTEVSPSVW